MSKHDNVFYLQLDRNLFDPKYRTLPMGARLLYVILTELEHRFTGTTIDYFYHSDKDVAEFAGISQKSVATYKKLLKDAGLIEHWNGHWKHPITGKLSEKKESAYRILRSRR